MTDRENREFDFVIFGATGFTGKYTVEYVTKTYEKRDLKWAIAGRNKSKLNAVLDDVSAITGKDIHDIPIIIADVDDSQSLADMCKRTKMVLNVVGPYSFYGEVVVRACIDNRAHHLDLSGEPNFLEDMELKYNEEAKKAGVYIMGATGFDSIPCETGLQVLREKFGGDLNSVESYIKFNRGPSGTKLNSGTWKSAIYGFPRKSDLKPIRRQILNIPHPAPKSNHVLKPRFPIFYNNDVGKWCMTFPVTDKSIVTRTNHFNYNYRQIRPVQIYTYLVLESLWLLFPLMIIGIQFGLLSLCKCGRDLLAKVEETTFNMILVGEGYSEKLADPDAQHKDPPKKKMILSVDGPEPGYVATPICMVEAALTVLQETEKLPNDGGVITAGAALWNTTLISRLEKAGMKYNLREP